MKCSAKLEITLNWLRTASLCRYAKAAILTTSLLIVAAVPARAQTVASSASMPPQADVLGVTKPGWLTVASVAAKEGYDSNIFGVSVTPAGHPDVANAASSYTTLSTNLTLDLLAASGTQKGGFFTNLTLAYAADFTSYRQAASEDNLRNTLTLTIKGKSGPWTLSIDNPLVYVDGSKEDPFYSTYSVLGYAATRSWLRCHP
jgi:hypothetical protein